MPWVPPEINHPAPGGIFVLGRDPGGDEMAYRHDPDADKAYPNGRPFVGLAGQELESVIPFLGMRRSDLNIGNVVGTQPPANEFKAHNPADVQRGLQELDILLKRLKPRLIIALGNEANYALNSTVWPSNGRGVYGSKGINDRRGYFWETPYGWVLSGLHPAGALRKPVPGHFLLENDFRRARKWLSGKLPREGLPGPARLSPFAVAQLVHSRFVGWDIETKWDNNAMLCSGYCGDDLVPYVASYPRDFETFGRQILTHPVPKCGHNGSNFDLPACKLFLNLVVNNYKHDTQHMWWALEPELAGQEESGAEEYESLTGGGSRMTRKALAVLPTIYDFNVPWWKDYPSSDDPDHLRKMMQICAVDVWVTKQLGEGMLAEIQEQRVQAQYDLSMRMIPATSLVHLRGLRVNKAMREARIQKLQERSTKGELESIAIALEYIRTNDLEFFRDLYQCECCGGGGLQRTHCSFCTYGHAVALTKEQAKAGGFKSMKALRESWKPCQTCAGTGKIKEHHFNPFSTQQLQALLYDQLGCPKSYTKKKTVADEFALRKILRWANV